MSFIADLLRQSSRILMFVVRVFVVRRRATAKCVITSDNEVLLIRHRIGSGAWTIPGGGPKRKESAADAAIREVGEEVGIDLEEVFDLGSFPIDRGYGIRDEVLLFHAEISRKTIDRDWLELSEAQWFSLDALPEGMGLLGRESIELYLKLVSR